ncbi:hypothetical protein [Altibacter sp.]|uniref:hypothetical protein n=1 Tax=Altibacter sp. TaxID=2024823 RepID=UPI0025C34DCD|nr:hypothetical protein [Altibacter sp.]
MKKMKKKMIRLVVATSLLTAVIACSPSNDDSSSNDASAQQTAAIARNGTWEITYFYDTDQEETGNFSGYSFSFNENGSLVAVNGSTTVTGTWSVTNSSNSSDDDGSNDDDDDFNIFFASPREFEELSDDWDIISVTETKIELIDVSGGNGGTDYLTFERQ